MRPRGVLVPLLAVVAILLVVGRWVSASVVSHAWYAANGASPLFWERFTDAALLQGGAWMLGSAFAFANLHAVRRTILAVAMPVRVGNLELTAMVPSRRLTVATAVLAMIVAALLAVPLTNWEDVAMARHGVPFGEIEGITGKDLGFFVYWLPLEETVYLWALVTVVAMTSVVLVLYALTRSLRVQGRRIAVSSHVRRHISVLGALVLLLLAWSYRLDAYDLLAQGSGPDGLFLRVDHHITLRADLVLAILCALAAPIAFRTGWMGQLRAAVLTLSLVLGAAVVLRHVVPVIAARSALLGAAPARDRDYIATRAIFSRRAFDVDGMAPETTADSLAASVPGTASPSPADGWATVRSASMYDAESVRAAIRGAREVGGARSAEAPYIGWWSRQDRLRALVLRPSVDRRDDWSMSVVPVERPVLAGGEEPVERVRGSMWPWPLIAPGLSGSVVMAAADAPEVVSVPLRTATARLAHAWAMRDPSLLRAHRDRSEPVIVTTRDVRERVQRLVPVLLVGRDVSPLWDGERVVWSMPLYSASTRYPLSQRWSVAGGVYGYLRLAGLAFVDAQTGSMRVLPVRAPDPIMRTWMQRAPQLIAKESEIGAALLAQVPPAYERALVQMHTFARYGSRDAAQRGTAVGRRLPDGILVSGHAPAPYLDRGDSASGRGALRWAVPLVNGAEQVDGLVVAFGGREPGTMWVPLPPPYARWRAVVPDSSRSREGAGRRPEEDARGKAFTPSIVPAAGGFMVWQLADHRRATGEPSPVLEATWIRGGEVRRSTGRTWQEIVVAFGGAAAGGEERESSGREPRGTLQEWYTRMRAALQRGDWSAFGAALDSLGGALRSSGTGGTPPP